MGVFAGSIEIQMLCWSIVLGLVQVVICAAMSTKDRGLPYNLGSRDAPQPDAGNVTRRLERATRNFLETFALFAAAVVIVTLLNKENTSSGLGAQIYFWARVAYVPAYASGLPFLRTGVWTVSIIGLVMVLLAAAA
jgi:uncharacterized MAPEG superfamily protein